MKKITLHYVLEDGGDGSAMVSFYKDQAAAELGAIYTEETTGTPAYSINTQDLYFDDQGRLLNPTQSKANLEYELAELKDEDLPEPDDYDADDATKQLAEAYKAEATPLAALERFQLVCLFENRNDPREARLAFYADTDARDVSVEIEDELTPYNDSDYETTLYFDATGVLLNPDSTAERLTYDIAEQRGEDVSDMTHDGYDQYEMDRVLSEQFAAASKAASAPKKPNSGFRPK